MIRLVALIALWLTCLPSPSFAVSEEEFQARRMKLLQNIESDVRETRMFIGKGRLDPKVMEAMAHVKRHKFVPANLSRFAYANRPLPIGYGQTISQPYIVALMTDLLEPKPDDVVLELGTGSGYQAAVLGKLVKEVYTTEIVPPLAEKAKKRLDELGYSNVTARVGDGYYGWKEKGPFDAIIVTAAASHIPPPLIKQLKSGGRMIIPVGGPFATQQLILVTKEGEKIKTQQILPVRFVPVTGKH